MRALLMHLLTVAMCGAAILAFGVAKAGEDGAGAPPNPGFVVIDPDARIPATRSINGYEVVDSQHILLRAGVNDLYLAELHGSCAHGVRFEWQIGIDTRGGAGIDRFSQLIVNGRRCPIATLSEVARVAETSPEPGVG